MGQSLQAIQASLSALAGDYKRDSRCELDLNIRMGKRGSIHVSILERNQTLLLQHLQKDSQCVLLTSLLARGGASFKDLIADLKE
jgi:hypothetical protein